jgi:glycosyltransferase involved in cell wall biosynthesis
MRVGQNPAKAIEEVEQPAEVTVAVVVYIPFLSGYYSESLDVLKLCLQSIWNNTLVEYDLMVFDNASCSEVREYLLSAHQRGRIQYLTLSDKNIGKAGAWNHIFGSAPGKYIAYADSDVYHFHGWLAPQLDTLKIFPKAGMVTGLPMLTPAVFSTATISWAEKNPDVEMERGRFLAWKDFWRHAQSLGGDEEKARSFYEENEDICILHADKRYYVGASHFQFVSKKEVLTSVLPIPSERPMGQVRLLDIAINEKGFLRLCTEQWYNQHMGNTVPSDDFFAVDEETIGRRLPQKRRRNKKLWRFQPVRRLLQWVYSRSFEILYKN